MKRIRALLDVDNTTTVWHRSKLSTRYITRPSSFFALRTSVLDNLSGELRAARVALVHARFAY